MIYLILKNRENSVVPNIAKVLDRTSHSDEASFSPARAVAVLQYPEVAINGVCTKPDEQHRVVDSSCAQGIIVNSPLVVDEGKKRAVNANCDWTSVVNKILKAEIDDGLLAHYTTAVLPSRNRRS